MRQGADGHGGGWLCSGICCSCRGAGLAWLLGGKQRAHSGRVHARLSLQIQGFALRGLKRIQDARVWKAVRHACTRMPSVRALWTACCWDHENLAYSHAHTHTYNHMFARFACAKTHAHAIAVTFAHFDSTQLYTHMAHMHTHTWHNAPLQG